MAALLPRLAHRGMFLDGVTYASIARNLAEGRGQFWAPHYTATIYPTFHEHPPLAFWLQAQWFRVLGDHWFVERVYAATAAGLTAVLMVITWRAVHNDARDTDWLPVVLWIAAPVVSWTIVGNLLEPTVAVFGTAAVAILMVVRPVSSARAIVGGILSGLCVVAAGLSKGPVGLFPLAAPLVLGILQDDRPRALRSCAAAQWLTVVLCGALLLAASEPRQSLARYLDEQVVSALAGRREVSAGSLTIVTELVLGVWLPMGVLVAIFLLAARAWIRPSPRERSIAAAFMVLALAGTLPLLISPKQAGHYLMPAVPFYAIAAGAFIGPTMRELVQRRLGRRSAVAIRMTAAALTLGAVVAAAVPVFEREPARMAALDRLALVAPRGATAGICPRTNSDWGLHAWFQRRFQMSLDAARPASHEWFLQAAGDGACAPATCRAASDASAELVLLHCDR